MATRSRTTVSSKLEKGECWKIAEAVLGNSARVLYYGPSGTGKTHHAFSYGKSSNEVVEIITLTPETSKHEIFGKWMPEPTESGNAQKFVWKDGIGIRAWRLSHERPVTLVLNELNHAAADAISALHPILDDKLTARITLDSGETVTRGEHFRVIATMNGEPEDLLPSLADRFPISIHIDSVHPSALETLSPEFRKIAAPAAVETDPEKRISFRSWQELDRLQKIIGLEMAAKAVVPKRYRELLDSIKIANAKK